MSLPDIESLAPQTSESSSDQTSGMDSQSSSQPSNQAENVLDLDKYDKPFRFRGKELTAQDLAKSTMLWSEFSKKSKTFEQKQKEYEEKIGQYSNQEKYWKNFEADLETLRKNPTLMNQFLATYPENFHSLARKALGISESEAQAGKQDVQTLRELNAIKSELEGFKAEKNEAAVAKSNAEIDQAFAKYSGKYQLADQINVLSLADSLVQKQNAAPTEKQWEMIFKIAHEQTQKRFESHYKALVNKQKEATAKGRDVQAGGGIPGQAPKRQSFKEATEAAIRDLTSGGSPH